MKSFELNRKVAMFSIFGASLVAACAASKGGVVQLTKVLAAVLARTPADRWGLPEDLAGIAVFLASHSSDFVTGVAIPVDGGYSCQG